MLVVANETTKWEDKDCQFTAEDSEGVNGIASDFIDFDTDWGTNGAASSAF